MLFSEKIQNYFACDIRHSVLQRGQALMTVVVFVMVISLGGLIGFSYLALKESGVSREMLRSERSYYLSEAGIEDMMYRIIADKAHDATEILSLGGFIATTTVTTAGSTKEIIAEGDVAESIRSVKAVLKKGAVGVSFFYGVQVGEGGLFMSNNARVNGNVYSNGSITGNSGATITGDATVAGGIANTPSIEWAAQNADQSFASTTGSRDIAQSFYANASDRINKASVYLGKVGSPTSDITLRITNDNSGKPATNDIANAVIQASSVGVTPSWIDVAFSNPPTLTNGSKYWIVLNYGSNSATNYWNWRKDTSDGYANNTGKYTSSWSAGGASWTNAGGDLAFRVWIGGVNTKIDGLTIGNATSGTGHANLFVNTTIHGSSCPNQYCIVGNPSQAPLPIPDGVIQDWRNKAAAGGTCVPPVCDALGNLNLVNGATLTLGPIKIPGTMTLHDNAVLTMTGTVWVLGKVEISNNSVVELAASYGTNSGVLLTDGDAEVHNNVIFRGSGQVGSYIMLLDAKNAPTLVVMEVNNGSAGVIYYASNGRIHFHNNAAAKEATAYGIDMDNGSTLTYESGLANTNFSSGPAGGYKVMRWKETE